MKRTQPMLRIVPATELKNKSGEVIRRVYEKDEAQIIERAGLPVAVIISIDEYIRMRPERAKQFPRVELSAKRERAAKQLRAILTEMQKGGEKLSEEEVMEDALRAVEEVRRTQTKQ